VSNVPTNLSVLRHVAITFYLVRVCTVLTVHSLYRHQLHGTICLHIFVFVPLCRSFYLNSSLIFSSPLSLLSNIIPYSPHTLFQFKSFFSILFLLLFSMFVFISVWCHCVRRPRALVVRRLSKSTNLIWLIWFVCCCVVIMTCYTSSICCGVWQYYRFSVGGMTDVAEIKGHRSDVTALLIK